MRGHAPFLIKIASSFFMGFFREIERARACNCSSCVGIYILCMWFLAAIDILGTLCGMLHSLCDLHRLYIVYLSLWKVFWSRYGGCFRIQVGCAGATWAATTSAWAVTASVWDLQELRTLLHHIWGMFQALFALSHPPRGLSRPRCGLSQPQHGIPCAL